MSTGTFDDVFKERSTGPYGKPIKCRVVAIDKPYEYKAKNGNNMKAQVAAVSDGGKVLILLCYDQTKFKFLEVNQTIVLRDVIRREDEGRPAIVITSATKTFITGPLEVPEGHKEQGEQIVNPPPPEVMPINVALTSPAKKRISIKGKVIQEEESRSVEVKGEPVPIKSITVEDESGQTKVTLWRELATADVRPGDFVLITDIVTNSYQNKTTLSTTTKSKVEKYDIPEKNLDITIEGICVNGDQTELLLDNGTCCLNVSMELLQVALSTDMDPVPEIETALHDGPLALRVISKGQEVLSICTQR